MNTNKTMQPSEEFLVHIREIAEMKKNDAAINDAFKDMMFALQDEKSAVLDRLLHPENDRFLNAKITKRNNKLMRLYVNLDQMFVERGGSSLKVSPDNIYRFLTIYEGSLIFEKLV